MRTVGEGGARGGRGGEEVTKRQIDMEQRIIDAASSKRQKLAYHSDGAEHVDSSTSATMTVNFKLQNELFLDGARVISIDATNQIILASGRASAVGAEHVFTKAPGWSCSADVSSSHHIYAGLQNGKLLVFDIRQPARPLHSMAGLSTNPVHTLHSVVDNNSCRKVLSASAVGPCMWDADNNQSRPHLLTGMDNQRVCISLRRVIFWWLPSGPKLTHQRMPTHLKFIYHRRQPVPLVQEN